MCQNVACGLSHIRDRPRVAYLVLVTVTSHGKRCGTDVGYFISYFHKCTALFRG